MVSYPINVQRNSHKLSDISYNIDTHVVSEGGLWIASQLLRNILSVVYKYNKYLFMSVQNVV